MLTPEEIVSGDLSVARNRLGLAFGNVPLLSRSGRADAIGEHISDAIKSVEQAQRLLDEITGSSS